MRRVGQPPTNGSAVNFYAFAYFVVKPVVSVCQKFPPFASRRLFGKSIATSFSFAFSPFPSFVILAIIRDHFFF